MSYANSRTGPSLLQLLTLPYVILVAVAAGTIGLLSYSAGRDAVDTVSNHALGETVSRISQAVDKHISGSEAVLETAFPEGLAPPSSIKDDLDALRTRLWLATSIHRDPNNYAYYGNRQGQFIGLNRLSEMEAELRLRTDGTSARSIYRYLGINGVLENSVQEQRVFEPRDRPWYKAAHDNSIQTWTSIYIDFKTLELVTTRTRRVNNAAGEFVGAVATDLSLQLLSNYLKELKLTANGFAFIVEPDGNLVATSRGPHIRKINIGEDDVNRRLNAAESQDPLISATYERVLSLTAAEKSTTEPGTSSFKAPDGSIIQVGYARLQDSAGLDWLIVVAVPREDFMYKVSKNVNRTLWLALLTCLLIVLIGIRILSLITRDLRKLSVASKALADGNMECAIPTDRGDEIGDLARSFAYMKVRLLTDRLTGIPNREAVTRHLEDKIIRQRRDAGSASFAVLFVDINNFKQINDRFGHDVGDGVLVELAQRLNSSIADDSCVARYGGDEFIVILDQKLNRKAAMAKRTELENLLARPLDAIVELGVDTVDLLLGGAIGLAMCPEDGNDIDTLIKFADKDMYQQKQLSKPK